MAIRIDAQTDLLSRTTGLPAFVDWTMMVWLYRVVDQPTDEGVWFLADSTSFVRFLGIYVLGTENLLYFNTVLTGDASAFGSVITTATWYHLAVTFDNTTDVYTGYLNGVQDAQATGVTGTTTWGFECLGNLGSPGGTGANMTSARYAGYKSWTAALTAAEIRQEMRVYLPVRLANLHRCTPLLNATHLQDVAGGQAWTASGTLTTEDGPPIAWSVRPPVPSLRVGVAPPATKAPPPYHRPWRTWRRVA